MSPFKFELGQLVCHVAGWKLPRGIVIARGLVQEVGGRECPQYLVSYLDGVRRWNDEIELQDGSKE